MMTSASSPTPKGSPGNDTPFDLVEATVLFRNLLACTFTAFGSILALRQFGSGLDLGGRLLVGAAVTLVTLTALVLSAITGTKLARTLRLSSPLAYGLGAALPCPSLLVLAHFGSRMLPAWSAAGLSPVVLFQSRRTLERTIRPRLAVPAADWLALIAVLLIVLVAIGFIEILTGDR